GFREGRCPQPAGADRRVDPRARRRLTYRSRGRPARSSPRRRNVDTARLQELLVQASDIVLAEGFTSITMDQLAQRLGCSQATLYSLAGTKDQLVQTITRHFFSTAAEEIEQAVAVDSDPAHPIRTYLPGA